MHLITTETRVLRAAKETSSACVCQQMFMYMYIATLCHRFGICKGEHPGGTLSTDNGAVRFWGGERRKV